MRLGKGFTKPRRPHVAGLYGNTKQFPTLNWLWCSTMKNEDSFCEIVFIPLWWEPVGVKSANV